MLSIRVTNIVYIFYSGTTLLGIKTARIALRYADRQIDHKRRSTDSLQRRPILRVRRRLTSSTFIIKYQ